MNTLKKILKTKGNKIHSIAPQESTFIALQQMAEHNIGALLVVDEGKLTGIFTERDYTRKMNFQEKSTKETQVCDIMTADVLYAEPDCTISECMALMTNKRIRHIPVMEHGQLIGIVSIGDIVKEIISEQEFTIQQLEKYITGSY